MTLEQNIQYLYIKYPSISPTRQSVLNYLYITIGNGYDWKNGQLISEIDHEDKNLIQKIKDKNHVPASEPGYKQGPYRIEEIILKRRFEQNKITKKEYKQSLNELNSKVYYSFYPFAKDDKYPSINNLPEDIKPDYLLGAIEACQDILKYCEIPEIIEGAQAVLLNISLNFDIEKAKKNIKRYQYLKGNSNE